METWKHTRLWPPEAQTSTPWAVWTFNHMVCGWWRAKIKLQLWSVPTMVDGVPRSKRFAEIRSIWHLKQHSFPQMIMRIWECQNVASPRCCLGTCRKNEKRIAKEQWPQKRALRYSKKARHIFTQSDFLASNMACYRQHISHWCSSKFMTVPSHQDSWHGDMLRQHLAEAHFGPLRKWQSSKLGDPWNMWNGTKWKQPTCW